MRFGRVVGAALAALLVVAGTGAGIGPISSLAGVAGEVPISRISGGYEDVSCGATPDCFELTDADADDDCADDLQEGFNDLVAAGGTPAAYTFVNKLTAPCNLNTVVRFCYDSSPPTGTTVPDCTGAGALPPIHFRGRWNKSTRKLICKASVPDTQPRGCLWFGDAWSEGNFSNLVELDVPAGSEPFIEQWRNDPSPASPGDAMRPLLCDGCTGTVGVRVMPSERTDLNGFSFGQFRLYVPPSFAGDNLDVRLFTNDARLLDAGAQPSWGDYVSYIGDGITVTGTVQTAPQTVGIYGQTYSSFTTGAGPSCTWDATWAVTKTCDVTWADTFSLAMSHWFLQDYLSITPPGVTATVGGVWDGSAVGSTAKPAVSIGYDSAGYAIGTVDLTGRFVSPPGSLNSVIKLTNRSGSPGTVTISGTIVRPAPPQTSDMMGVICTPQSVATPLPVVYTADAVYEGAYGWMNQLGYDVGIESGCDLTVPGESTGTVAVGSGAPSVPSDQCINLSIGALASCGSAATQNTVAQDTIVEYTQLALTSDVTGGKLCDLDIRVNGGAPTCSTCADGLDRNNALVIAYGGTPLDTSGETKRLRHMTEVLSGGYWQVRVKGNASCQLTGTFDLSWKTFPAF